MRKRLLSRDAERDLLGIARHTQLTWGGSKRKEYMAGISQNINELTRNPNLGTTCDEVKPGLKYRPQGSHVIFYYFDDKCLYVVRVLHEKMDVVQQLLETKR